jgi:hypothetical protein
MSITRFPPIPLHLSGGKVCQLGPSEVGRLQAFVAPISWAVAERRLPSGSEMSGYPRGISTIP